MHILIVDDSPTALLHSRLCMEEAAAATGKDVTVATAPDGEEALRMIALHAAQLVILDVQLPGISGFEVCTEMKSGGRKPRVAFVTGSADTQTLQKAKAAGADYFIGKPISADSFMEILEA